MRPNRGREGGGESRSRARGRGREGGERRGRGGGLEVVLEGEGWMAEGRFLVYMLPKTVLTTRSRFSLICYHGLYVTKSGHYEPFHLYETTHISENVLYFLVPDTWRDVEIELIIARGSETAHSKDDVPIFQNLQKNRKSVT